MRLSGTKATAIHQYRGLGNQLWDLAGNRPSLDLRFADEKSLVDATTGTNLIDFIRASSGTYVGSDGLIKTATTNLLLQSEDLTVGPWTAPGSISVSADNTQGTPFAGASVYKIEYSGPDEVFAQPVVFAAATYTGSVWIKGTVDETIRFAAKAGEAASTFTLNGAWQRIPLGPFTATAGTANFGISTFAGVTARTIYVAAPQLEQSSTVGEYIPTTSTINSAPRFDHKILRSTTNLALYSETFDEPEYTVQGLTKSFSTIDTPFGTKSVMLATETEGVSEQHRFYDGILVKGSFIASIFVKVSSGTRTVYFSSDTSAGRRAIIYDVTSASPSVVSSGFTDGDIEDYGNGWFRLWVKSSGDPDGNALNMWGLGNGAVYAGDGSSSFYFFGAQFEQSESLTAYVKTEATPVTKTYTESLGLLVEESRTNLLGYSEDISSWSQITGGSPIITPNDAISPDGTNTATRIENTSALAFLGDATAFTAGVTYTFSGYFKAGTGNFVTILLYSAGGTTGYWDSQTSNVARTFDLSTGEDLAFSGGVDPTSFSIKAAGNGWYRCSITATCTVTHTGSQQLIRNTSGLGDNILAWGYQIEAGSSPTSYIPTVGAGVITPGYTTPAVTRAADVASISGANFSSWYRQDEGTVFAEASYTFDADTSSVIWQLDDTTNANRNGTSFRNDLAGNQIRAYDINYSASPAGFDLHTFTGTTSNGTYKNVYALKTNDMAATTNYPSGILPIPVSSSRLLQAKTVLRLGSGIGNALPLNGYLRRLTYWPTHLSNDTLQTITN